MNWEGEEGWEVTVKLRHLISLLRYNRDDQQYSDFDSENCGSYKCFLVCSFRLIGILIR